MKKISVEFYNFINKSHLSCAQQEPHLMVIAYTKRASLIIIKKVGI